VAQLENDITASDRPQEIKALATGGQLNQARMSFDEVFTRLHHAPAVSAVLDQYTPAGKRGAASEANLRRWMAANLIQFYAMKYPDREYKAVKVDSRKGEPSFWNSFGTNAVPPNVSAETFGRARNWVKQNGQAIVDAARAANLDEADYFTMHIGKVRPAVTRRTGVPPQGTI
jgi:hypothetical protein